MIMSKFLKTITHSTKYLNERCVSYSRNNGHWNTRTMGILFLFWWYCCDYQITMVFRVLIYKTLENHYTIINIFERKMRVLLKQSLLHQIFFKYCFCFRTISSRLPDHHGSAPSWQWAEAELNNMHLSTRGSNQPLQVTKKHRNYITACNINMSSSSFAYCYSVSASDS